MKRSIIAVAALLLLSTSMTYANPPRRPRGPRFWRSVLTWFSFGHHGPHRMARLNEHGQLPPGHRGRPYMGPGRHEGWRNGRHEGWNRNAPPRGRRPDGGERREGERGHGRGGGRGRG